MTVRFHCRRWQRLLNVDILALAKIGKRVVITFDLDFGGLLARSGDRLPSVIQFRTEDARVEEVGRLLIAVISIHAEALEEGCILTIEPDRIRVRKLPLS